MPWLVARWSTIQYMPWLVAMSSLHQTLGSNGALEPAARLLARPGPRSRARCTPRVLCECLWMCRPKGTPPSSVVVNTQGRESGGSWFETCSGVWYPSRRPCGVAINTLVDLNKLAGETPSLPGPRRPKGTGPAAASGGLVSAVSPPELANAPRP